MAVRLEAGFPTSTINQLDFDIEEWSDISTKTDDDNVVISYTGADLGWSHSDFSDYLGTNLNSTDRYPDLAGYLNTVIGLLGTAGFSVTFDTSTLQYKFTADSGDLCKIVPNNTATEELLGFSAAVGPAATASSDQTPKYIYESQNVLANYSEDYEEEFQDYSHESESGEVYHTTSLGRAVMHDFTLRMEPKAGVYTFANSGYWDLQRHFEHCRARVPFLVTHEAGSAIHHLRGTEAFFKANRSHPEHDDYWDVEFRTYVTRSS